MVDAGKLSIAAAGLSLAVTAARERAARRRCLTADGRAVAAQRELAHKTADLERYATELERSNAELEQFAYIASHDLSEPLRTVSGFVRLLAQRYEGRLDASADEFIGYALDGTARMQRLIDDLLRFSRVGRAELARVEVDLDALLHETLAGLRIAIESAGASVSFGPLPTVTGDTRQLSQLLQNLVANALKFVAPGQSPVVEISAARAGESWEVRVADHGIGIDPTQRERIFAMFGRLHAREEYEGTGIGLALVQRIATRHGGSVSVHDTPGGGTTFVVALPAARARGAGADRVRAPVASGVS